MVNFAQGSVQDGTIAAQLRREVRNI
jgi:hypothetical protein